MSSQFASQFSTPGQALRSLLVVIAGLLLVSPAFGQEKDDVTDIDLFVGRSKVVETEWAVSNISVADPDIADVQAATPQKVVIVGKKTGATDVVMWGEQGETIHARVRVTVDIDLLQADLERFFPTAKLNVIQRDETLVVTGTFRRAEEIKSLDDLLAAKGVNYVNMTSLAGVQQVMLRVKIAEASRNAVRALGINWVHAHDGFFAGNTIGGNGNNINIGAPSGAAATNIPFAFNNATSVSSAVSLFTGFPDADLQLFLEALEDNQYLRILAEPNLVALSGEEASFLAGGEVPIPVVQGSSAGAGSTITIEYKEFGVRLQFVPKVLGDGTIRLSVAPEVSDVSNVNSVSIEGFNIPSFVTRRAHTTLEMKSGQTFAMAGLIDRNTLAQVEKVPALGSVNTLGALFRSTRYQNEETELIVLVTANLVEPISSVRRRPLPGDLHKSPNDWELYAEGRLESKEPRRLSPDDMKRIRELGLHELRGPGAWATYDQEPKPMKEDVVENADESADEPAEPAKEAVEESAEDVTEEPTK